MAPPESATIEAPFTTGTLEERRDQLVTLLSDESIAGEDAQRLMAEATEVETRISEQNVRRNEAEATRARLSSARFVPAVTPGAESPSATETVTRTNDEGWNVRSAVQDFASRAQAYQGGRLDLNAAGLDVRAVLTTNGAGSTNSAAAFVPLVPQPGVIPVYPSRPLRLADLINKANTNTGIIEYVRDTTSSVGGNAAEVAESATKPESTYTFDLVVDTVRTVAHFSNISRQVVADLPQLENYVENRLIYGLGYRVDNQILNGDGSGVNLRGIFATSGINVYSPAAAGTPYTEARVISIRKAMTPIYQNEYAPTVVGMSPGDWQYIELSQDANGEFRVSPNVQNELNPRIWGLNVVQSTAFTDGTALVGDFRMGATLWDRQQATVYMTDSHASNFTANVLTLLAELRVGLAIHRVAAFTKVVFNPGATAVLQ